MALTDDDIKRLAEATRTLNGQSWHVDKTVSPITLLGALVSGALILGGWVWFGGQLSYQVQDHTKAIEKLEGAVGKISNNVQQIREDFTSWQSKRDEQMQELINRVQAEETGKLKKDH